MRKERQTKLFDNIMWYIIYLLPILLTFSLMLFNSKVHFADNSFTFDFLSTLESNLTLLTSNNNIVYTTLNDIFGTTGIMPLFNNTVLILYFTYFVNCTIIHVVIDILAFIPRIAEKLIDKVVK